MMTLIRRRRGFRSCDDLFALFSVLTVFRFWPKGNLLQCQVGREISYFGLVVAGHDLAVPPVSPSTELILQARPVGRFCFLAISGVFCSARKSGWVFLCFGVVLRPSGCFSVRGSGGFRWSVFGVLWFFGGVFSLCLLVVLHLASSLA